MDSLLSPSASGSESVSQIARFVSIEKCGCAEFDFDYDFHAAIEAIAAELKNDNAVAMSYTWGTFNREDRLIGHKKDYSTASVRLNLGEEWVFPDFIDRLILAAIPDIYCTLDVQVLMCGNVCRCFKERVDPLLRGEPGKFEEVIDGQGSCYNEVGMSSHTGRLWPRQEFLYARSVQLKWNFKTFAECVPCPLPRINGEVDESVIEKLNPYTKILYKQLVESNINVMQIERDLALQVHDHFSGLYNSFNENERFDAETLHDEERVGRVFSMFLLGHRVEKRPLSWQIRRGDLDIGSSKEMADYITESDKLWWFISTTAELRRSTRSATQSKDYVLSVFVDMPRYVIPAERKIMKPLELLEDHAIVQMENKLNVTMPTRAPAGLFNKLPSVSWRPSLHLSKDHFQTAAEVYSSLPGYSEALQFIAGRVPLRKFVADSRSIVKRSSLYSDSFPQEDMAMVASICGKISSNWPPDFCIRLRELERYMFDSTLRVAVQRFYRGKETEFKYEEGLPFSEDFFVQCLLIHHLVEDGDNKELVWTNMHCIDHHDTLYRVTSFLLGMDYKICQDHGLKLIIALDEPVCLGLFAKTFLWHGQPASANDVSSKDNYLTVSTSCRCGRLSFGRLSFGDLPRLDAR